MGLVYTDQQKQVAEGKPKFVVCLASVGSHCRFAWSNVSVTSGVRMHWNFGWAMGANTKYGGCDTQPIGRSLCDRGDVMSTVDPRRPGPVWLLLVRNTTSSTWIDNCYLLRSDGQTSYERWWNRHIVDKFASSPRHYFTDHPDIFRKPRRSGTTAYRWASIRRATRITHRDCRGRYPNQGHQATTRE